MLKQVDMDNAVVSCDAMGVPIVFVPGVGTLEFHPAYVAVYALVYAGLEAGGPQLPAAADLAKFRACVRVLVDRLKERAPGLWAWEYPFSHVYNDIETQGPWISAFAQAMGIEALVASYRLDENHEHLELAQKASRILYQDVREGGLLFRHGEDIWFEEISLPVDDPRHNLNGHMRALRAVHELAETTGKPEHRQWFEQGIATLKKWLPLYDSGYWLRKDLNPLNPKKAELLFRFNNPYGFTLPPLAIHKIKLTDPCTGESVEISLGVENDAEGELRISGIDWGKRESFRNLGYRRLKAVTPASYHDELQGGFHHPHTYFYLCLPDSCHDPLCQKVLELEITYWDETPGNIAVQMRAITSGKVFLNLPDGDLLLSGSGEWRTWRIPISPNCLGESAPPSDARYHQQALASLSILDTPDDTLVLWSQRVQGYRQSIRLSQPDPENRIQPQSIALPPQTVPNGYTVDSSGVLMQYFQTDEPGAILIENILDPGRQVLVKPYYQPFVIASQVLDPTPFLEESKHFFPQPAPVSLDRDAALAWLLNEKNFVRLEEDTVIYDFPFQNTYNNIVSPAPWQSAFIQTYIMKAVLYAIREKLGPEKQLKAHLTKLINAFTLDTRQGGLISTFPDGTCFAEEVPNGTHILNAHMITCLTLLEIDASLSLSSSHKAILQSMLDALTKRLAMFDTGYWCKYDQNPKTEVLLQIDWLWGDESPAIHEIILENPRTGRHISLNAGTNQAFEGTPRLSGTEWREAVSLNTKKVRPFHNGYHIHPESESTQQNSVRHHVYLCLPLPDPTIPQTADDPPYRLIIHYLDRAEGHFNLKIQSIHEGNKLCFTPLRQGVWHCVGDQAWKTVEFPIYPQDTGWFVGEKYHLYHLTCLQELAQSTNFWLYAQYAEKWAYYLKTFQAGSSAIIVSDKCTKEPPPKKKRWTTRIFNELKRFRRRFSKKNQGPALPIKPEGSEFVYSAKDPLNPLHPFRHPITQDIVDTARKILPNTAELTDHEKIIRVMDFLNDFKVGTAPDASLTALLKHRIALCGDFSNLTLALLTVHGVWGRMITLANFPENAGHAVIECWVNDRWQLYDPTYAAYYTSSPEDACNPSVLSFDELRLGHGSFPSVQCVVGNPERLAEGQAMARALLGPEIYEKACPAGPIGLENPMIYPLRLDVHDPQPLWREQFGTRFQGADYLGASAICNLQQWTLTSLQPGCSYRFEITPDHSGGEPHQGANVFTAEALVLGGGRITSGTIIHWPMGGQNPAAWMIEFTAYHHTVSLLLTHAYRGPNLWYVAIKSFRLVSVTGENLTQSELPETGTLKKMPGLNALIH